MLVCCVCLHVLCGCVLQTELLQPLSPAQLVQTELDQPFEQQVAGMANTGILLTTHGANMVNAMFLPKACTTAMTPRQEAARAVQRPTTSAGSLRKGGGSSNLSKFPSWSGGLLCRPQTLLWKKVNNCGSSHQRPWVNLLVTKYVARKTEKCGFGVLMADVDSKTKLRFRRDEAPPALQCGWHSSKSLHLQIGWLGMDAVKATWRATHLWPKNRSAFWDPLLHKSSAKHSVHSAGERMK